MYNTVLFDLDHTLLDSETSQTLAYEATMVDAGIADPGSHFDAYARINAELWAEVETGAIGPNDVRYRRFERFVSEQGLEADALAMADRFIERLGSLGELYPGARLVLDKIGAMARLGLVTNGIGSVQRARIERLGIDDVFDTIVISGEVGTAKPDRAIFDLALRNLGITDRTGVLMIGDGLSSDIAGGINAGIDTCWFNPNRTVAPPEAPVAKYEIASLTEIAAIVGVRR